jgi:hypothetical protein
MSALTSTPDVTRRYRQGRARLAREAALIERGGWWRADQTTLGGPRYGCTAATKAAADARRSCQSRRRWRSTAKVSAAIARMIT